MTRTLSYTILLVSAAVSIILVATRPEWVSDQNIFLRDFVSHEFLGLLGVILAITLASVANIHLEFNKIEERYQKVGLTKSRSNIKKGAYWLIGLFIVGVIIAVTKPIINVGATSQGVANMAALFIVLWQVLILVSLTQLVFAIPPHINDSEPEPPREAPSATGKTRRQTSRD
jgi:uncharacterized membrane protein